MLHVKFYSPVLKSREALAPRYKKVCLAIPFVRLTGIILLTANRQSHGDMTLGMHKEIYHA